MSDDIVTRRYTNGEYAEKNPDWDSSDAPWKAGHVAALLAGHGLQPTSIVEIGCGSGAILVDLKARFPAAEFHGFDIAPGLQAMWARHTGTGIQFRLGDYFEDRTEIPDLILLLDVLEHLGDPFEFLARLRPLSRNVVLHFPLDLSAVSVLRESPLLHVRDKVGHLHYFTKGLALALLDECGFDVVEARYTGAAFNAPQRGMKTRIFGGLRKLVGLVHRDFAARLLGGETLMVLARPRSFD